MTRVRITSALILTALVLTSYSLHADVRADQKSRVEFSGMLGRMFNLFGGKAAREGTTSTVAVKGDRKATLDDKGGQIIDLAEEKIYVIDTKKKSYKVTTFAELRRQMEEARKKAEEDARKVQAQDQAKEPGKPAEAAPAEQQVEVDFNVKDTGEKKTINGFATRQMIMTITVREKGKTLEQGGGMVTTTDMWLTPAIAAMKDVRDFDIKYAQKLYGSTVPGVSAEQMAAAMAMYPMMKPALERMRTEGSKIDGTAILTTLTMEAVKSADQIAEEARQTESASSDSKPTGVGGLLGGFGKKIAAKKMSGGEEASKPRLAFMTTTTEVLKVVTDVAAADVAIPAGYKENK